MNLSLLTSILFSILIHLGLLIYGPNISYSDFPDLVQEPVEIEMVRRQVPIPDALKPKPIPLVPKPEPLELNSLLSKQAGIPRPTKPSLRVTPSLPSIKKALKSRPLGGVPKLNLPKRVTSLDQITQARLKPAPQPVGGDDFPLTVPGPSAGLGERKKSVLNDNSGQYINEEIARLETLRDATSGSQHAIRGPAATRRIVFRPPAPKSKVAGASGDITLRFWVLADGTVGRVIPVRKGSAYLEGIAVNHMKRWRFSPLPPGSPQREEWGLVVFRFRVR